MSLTRKQMQEIVAFDWRKRTGLTATWALCHGSDVFKGKAKPARKTLRYNYIVPARAGASGRRPGVTVVHVAVRLNGACQPVVKDVGRWHIETGRIELRDIDYHGLAGWIVEWDKEDWAAKRPKRRALDFAAKICDARWCGGGGWKFNCGHSFPWHETVNPEALKGTKYEYCQYADAAPCRAGLVDWLMLYNQEPKIELLAKAGMYALICPAGIKALKNRRIRDWCMAHREEIARARGCRSEVGDILYAARHGVTVKAAASRRRFVEEARRFIHGGPWRIDYDRLRKEIRRWHIGLNEYSRYLEYASAAGLDLRNDGTLYPPAKGGREAFMTRLEKLESRARHIRRENLRKDRLAREAEEKWIRDTMGTRAAELAAFQKSLKRTDILKGSGYTLVLAKTQKELLAEGRKMGNCVGCGTYGRAIVRGDSLIVMLKNRSASYCDIEVDRKNWTVKQCYLKHNEAAPKEVQELAKRLAEWFKAVHRDHMKRGTFKELRKGVA